MIRIDCVEQVDQEDTNGSGSPNEEEDLSNCGDTPRGSWASLDLRHSQHDPLLPSLLDRVCPETIDQMNEQKRSEDRQVSNKIKKQQIYIIKILLNDILKDIDMRLILGSFISIICSSNFS